MPPATPKQRVQFWILVSVFAVGAAVLYWAAFQSRFNLSNIDGISYVSISHHYIDGHLDAAINAYWSPFMSWMMIPFMLAGATDILASCLVTATASIVATALAAWIVWRWTQRNVWLTGFVLVTLIVFCLGNLAQMTPDLLVVAWVLGFTAFLIRIDDRLDRSTRRERIWMGVALGALCVVGYYIKLYLVPVFVVVLALWWLTRWVRARRRSSDEGHELARAVTGLIAVAAGTLVVLALPWVIAISVKYEMVTIGTSFAVNVDQKFEPEAQVVEGPPLVPNDPTILHEPPNEYAVSFGEDRTRQVELAERSDAGIVDRLQYYVSQRIAAFPYYLNRIASIAPFAVPLMAVFGSLILLGRVRYRENAPVIVTSLVWTVYFIGYALITSASSGGGNLRYYWPMFILALVAFALLWRQIWGLVADGPRWRKIIAGALLALVPLTVVWQHYLDRDGLFATSRSSTTHVYLFEKADRQVEQRFAEDELSTVIPSGSKLVGEVYRATLKYGYFLDGHVYGRAGLGYSSLDPRYHDLMRTNGIDYFLQFTPPGEVPEDLSALGEVVGEFTTEQACDDFVGTVIPDCKVTVVKVAR